MKASVVTSLTNLSKSSRFRYPEPGADEVLVRIEASGLCHTDIHAARCGSCDYCVRGWETMCEAQRNTGYAINGGFAEYAVAFARFAVRVPEAVSALDAAPRT